MKYCSKQFIWINLSSPQTWKVATVIIPILVNEVTQSCPTLCDPWTVAYQAPQSMGFSRQEYWSGLPFPSPRDLLYPGIEPGSPHWRQMLYRLRHFWWGNESTEELGNLLSNCWLSEKQRLDWNEVTWLHSMDSLLPMFPLKKLTEPPGQWLCCPFNFPSDWIH